MFHCHKKDNSILLLLSARKKRRIFFMDQKPPVKGMTLIPMGLPLMFDAWLGCVLWAAQEKEVSAAFTGFTGFALKSLVNCSPIDQMIDKATGYDVTVLAAFCDYVTKEIWGEESRENKPL